MFGHFCGATEDEAAAALAQTGSLIATAESLSRHGHSLKPVEIDVSGPSPLSTLEEIADPERPVAPPEFLKMFVGERPRARRIGRVAKVIGLGIAVLLLILTWRFTPLVELTDPAAVRQWFADFADAPAAPAIVLAIFVIGGLLVFPVTVLIAVTAATFGPWLGFAYAGVGALASAMVAYGVGALAGRQALEDVMGPRLNRVRRSILRRGVLAIAAVRMVPIAPFTLVNLAAGASKVPLSDYLIGTILGMLPGLIVISALGHQIINIIAEPTPLNVFLLVAAVLAWIGVSLATQAFITRWRSAKESAQS
jgi:uncharacterized membrane protein YdjX (TVP38/TMEM64 family)